MVANAENKSALLELILDLKLEALDYQQQADEQHEFALHMMKERDELEQKVARLERENEELSEQRDTLRGEFDAVHLTYGARSDE